MKDNNIILGLTIRKWFNDNNQAKLENSYLNALIKLSKKMKVTIQPIVQVNAPEYGDNDLLITKKVYRKLKANKVKVLNPKVISGLKNGLSIYSKIDLLLGMRMHSNILASILGKPFVAISYEHKTEGISRQLGLGKYCIKCDQVDENNLYNLLITACKNRHHLQKQMINSINKIRISESTKWKSIIESNIN